MKTIFFTIKGYEELKEKLDTEIAKRPDAVAALQKGREMGDLSENGLYKAAKFELSNLDRNIRHLKFLLAYGKAVSPVNKETVQIGHLVKIKNTEEEKEYSIVGDYEADPKENKISTKSPIGMALFGKKVGDKIEITKPNGASSYEIISIN